MQHLADGGFITRSTAVEHAVKPAKEALLTVVFALMQRLEQRRAQGRGKDHCHEYGEHHCRDDGDRELAINRARGAAKKCHRDKYRRQHHGDTDQRALNLSHRFARGLTRGKPFLAHNALDVFHHHDGIIHQQADGQHHGEHGQGVDAVTEGIQHRKGSQQHHRHRNGGDQRGAEVLQEQVHHEEHQRDSFEQGFHHIFDGGFYE